MKLKGISWLGIIVAVVSGATMPLTSISVWHLIFMVVGVVLFSLSFLDKDVNHG